VTSDPPSLALSAIVPTLDEAGGIEETLSRARVALGEDTEILVVDGGSRDGTRTLAARHARVLECEPCRGVQLHHGAHAARGDILVFLHADTWLSPGAGAAIRGAVAGGAVGGCCRLAVRGEGWRYRWLERGIAWRTRRFGTATGDQALFATRESYALAGGFGPYPLFEDVRFVRALRRLGPFVSLEAVAATSPRRWTEHGFLRTVVGHWLLRARHAAGAEPATLARRYDHRRERCVGRLSRLPTSGRRS